MRSKQKNRRGSVLVMVALMLGAFTAIAAIAADIGRFYVVTGELQTAADAAALKGASVLQFATTDFEATVDAAVATWAPATNRADGQTLQISPDSVDIGYWQPTTRTFTTPTPTGLRPNAVSVKAAGLPRGVFAQLMGRTTGLPLSRRAIAWIGNVSLNCTRPWALQYLPLVEDVNLNSDTTKSLDMTRFVEYQKQSEASRTMIFHNEELSGMSPPPDDGVWNAYNLPSNSNGGANSGKTTYQGQIASCNNIAMNSDAGDGNLQPSTGVGDCGYGTIICWAIDVIEGTTSGPQSSRGPGICNLEPGDATCYNKSTGEAGVVIDIAFANRTGNGAGSIDFKYVGETELLCFFKSTTDVCNAIPDPRQKDGYTPGTLVVVTQGLKSRKLNPTDLVSNAPSNVQRLFLVR